MALIKARLIQARLNRENPSRPAPLEYSKDPDNAAEINARAQEIIDAAQAQAEQIKSQIIEAAKIEEARILAAAQAQMQSLMEEAEKLAQLKADTKNAAYQEGLAESEQIRDELLNILSNFQHTKEKLLNEVEDEIASIAIAVAEKLLQHEIKKDKTGKAFLTRQIRSAIAKVVKGPGLVKLLVAPEDYENSKSLKNALKSSLDEAVKLHFEADETVEPGTCIIETKGGRFDASFSTQINVIKVALEKNLGHKVFDLEEKYPNEDEMSRSTHKLNINEPSDQDLDALLHDVQLGKVFDDEDLSAKFEEDLEDDLDLDDDLDDEEDSSADDDSDEVDDLVDLEEDLGAVDEDLDLIGSEDVFDDAFGEEDAEDGDERFPEY